MIKRNSNNNIISLVLCKCTALFYCPLLALSIHFSATIARPDCLNNAASLVARISVSELCDDRTLNGGTYTPGARLGNFCLCSQFVTNGSSATPISIFSSNSGSCRTIPNCIQHFIFPFSFCFVSRSICKITRCDLTVLPRISLVY